MDYRAGKKKERDGAYGHRTCLKPSTIRMVRGKQQQKEEIELLGQPSGEKVKGYKLDKKKYCMHSESKRTAIPSLEQEGMLV